MGDRERYFSWELHIADFQETDQLSTEKDEVEEPDHEHDTEQEKEGNGD